MGEYITRLIAIFGQRATGKPHPMPLFETPVPLYIPRDKKYCMPIGFWSLALSGVVVSGCGVLFHDPEISVQGVSLSVVTISASGLDVIASVENRIMFGITLQSLYF